MKRYLMLAVCVMACLSLYALNYDYRFDDTPLSTALTQMSRQHPELRLSFIYDELDNYRTSARIDTDNGLEAVRRLTSRLPVRVSQTRSGIYVEAMQRGLYRYTGRAVGDGGEGVPHAIVMALAPKDSTVLTYVFTDNGGRFAIPCDVRNVILKLSSVGYLTTYRKATAFNIGDVQMTQAPVTLDNLTVKTERVRMEADKMVFMPGKREKNASHGGADLLLAMGLPTVRVNPIDKAITTNLGEKVQTFIDYLPADKNRLAGMRPQDVRYVEVYENPQDPRFEGARYAVNFIMVKYEYGGYTKGDYSMKLPDPAGDYALNSKFSYRKMTYDLSAGGHYENDSHTRDESQENFVFPDKTVTWDTRSAERYHSSHNEYVTFRAVYSGDGRVMSNTVGYEGDGGRFRHKGDNAYTPQVYPDNVSINRMRSQSNSANWYGNYRFFLPRGWTLTVNPKLRYSYHSLRDTYQVGDNGWNTDARENAWLGFLNFSGMKKWGRQSLTASVLGQIRDNSLRYVGSDFDEVRNYSESVGLSLESRISFGKFWMEPMVVCHYIYRKSTYVKDRRFQPKYYLELGCHLNGRHQLSVSAVNMHTDVGVDQRSPNVVIRNMFEAVTGNPSLTNPMYSSVMGMYNWNVCDNLFLSALCQYSYVTKPITPVYTPVVINGRQMMLRSLEREGYYKEFRYGGTVSGNLLNRSLNFWVSAYGYRNSRGGRYCYSGSFLRLSGAINYYLKNFHFSAYYRAREKSVSEEARLFRTPSYYHVSAGWGAKGFNVTVEVSNFLRSSTRWVYREIAYENYSNWVQNYSRINSCGVNIRLSYSFSYGRKVKQDSDLGGMGAIDSGILQ